MSTNFGMLSAREMRDKGYSPAKILLNGEEVLSGVTLINDIEGWIDVLDLENGEIVVNESKDGPRIKRMHGEIDFLPNQGQYR